MMGTTHAFFGAAIGSVLVFIAPEFAVIAVVAGAAGGLFPDLDMPFEHRKTLHFLEYYSVAAVVFVGIALLAPSAITVGLAMFLMGAAVHCWSDLFGGGLELKPWEQTDNRAVFLHSQQKWLHTRRGVRYDGSPEDLALSVVLALPLIVLFDDWIRILALLGLSISLVYTLLRKKIVEHAPKRFK